MFTPPSGDCRPAAAGRGLTRRERRLIRGVAALSAALIAAVIISLAVQGPSTGHGCVHATFPGPVGAEQIDRCGAAAHRLCRTLNTPGGLRGEAARDVAAQCRKAGIAVGGRGTGARRPSA